MLLWMLDLTVHAYQLNEDGAGEEMDGEAIVDWTCAWLRENKPNVTEWNFDLNENHSVDVPHYHVFTYEPPEPATKTSAKKRKLNASASDLSAI